jgi:drug/metabolite transporter (DMT)-like permease
MSTKTLAKTTLVIHVIAGIIMVAMGIYASFSQSATSPDGDKFLRLYLSGAQWTFLILSLKGKDIEKRIHLGWAKIRHWQIWLVIAASFVGISATNVIDYSLADPNQTDSIKVLFHYIFTALGAASATFFAWHYYPKGTEDRKLAMLSCLIGALAFGLSVLFTKLGWSFLSIAIGELVISTMIALVVWPVINEQLD